MRKLNIEIYPFFTQGLSPRHHITDWTFEKIREAVIKTIGERHCEVCGEKEGKIELHESASFADLCYKFEGFYLLCADCHDVVHDIQFGTSTFSGSTYEIDRLWEKKIKQYGPFKNKSNFKKHIHTAFENAFDFMMAPEVTCDYSNVAKYELDPKYNFNAEALRKSFYLNYNHFSGRIRWMVCYLLSGIDQNKEMQDKIFGTYCAPNKNRKYLRSLQKEHAKHAEFYKREWPILIKASQERERIILDYAETMRMQLIASEI